MLDGTGEFGFDLNESIPRAGRTAIQSQPVRAPHSEGLPLPANGMAAPEGHPGEAAAQAVEARQGQPSGTCPVLSAASPRHEVRVRIFRPARSAMQAGKQRSRRWQLVFEPRYGLERDPLMGWSGSRDVMRHVTLSFPSRERAVAFAERQGWSYTVVAPREERTKPRFAADNVERRPPLPRSLSVERTDGRNSRTPDRTRAIAACLVKPGTQQQELRA